MCQCFRVSEGKTVFDFPAVDDISHCEFDLFAAKCVRDIGNCDNPGGNMPGRSILTNSIPDAFQKIFVQFVTRPKFYEQNDPDVVFPVLTDHQAVQDFRKGFYLSVYFRRANAHSPRIEGCVRASVDDYASVPGDLDVVAVSPYPFVCVKVGALIPPAVRVGL